MKMPGSAKSGWAVFLVLVLAGVMGAQAQQPARKVAPGAGPSGAVAKIQKLIGTGRDALVETPEYRASSGGNVRRPGTWAEIKTVFDTAPEWVNELVFHYYVMTMQREGGAISVFTGTVRHANVQQGRDHFSAMYLPPKMLLRHGGVVAVAVEMSIDDKVVDLKTEQTKKLPANWWKSPEVLQSEKISLKPDALLPREKTPFAFVNWDDYEGAQ
jgi:hypothetical protein